MITLISTAGILIHTMIARHINGNDISTSNEYIIHVMVGIVVMMALYFLDYTLLARFSRVIAVILLAMCLLTLLFGSTVNGMSYSLFLGRNISVQAFMLFYVPIYGGVIYKYHGLSYKGLIKAAAWMVMPVVLVLRLPSIMTAGLMLISMLVMLTIAIQKDWFIVQKKKTIGGLWGIFMAMPVVAFLMVYWGNGLAPYAAKTIKEIYGKFENIQMFPGIGADLSKRDSFRTDYKYAVWENYVIIYKVGEEYVEIYRVVNRYRDITKVFE